MLTSSLYWVSNPLPCVFVHPYVFGFVFFLRLSRCLCHCQIGLNVCVCILLSLCWPLCGREREIRSGKESVSWFAAFFAGMAVTATVHVTIVWTCLPELKTLHYLNVFGPLPTHPEVVDGNNGAQTCFKLHDREVHQSLKLSSSCKEIWQTKTSAGPKPGVSPIALKVSVSCGQLSETGGKELSGPVQKPHNGRT